MTQSPRRAAAGREGSIAVPPAAVSPAAVSPASAARGAAQWAAPADARAETRDDVRRRLHATVDVARLPRPPRSGTEWRERADAVYADVPGLFGHLADAPIGWIPLIEQAAREVKRLLPRTDILVTSQVKEKFGDLRWYAHVSGAIHDMEPRVEEPALGALAWAMDASMTTCAAFGTTNATGDAGDGWWLTLSPEAIAIRRRDRDALRRLLYPDWACD